MSKRAIVVLTTLGLVATGLFASPGASAQTVTEVPSVVQITDPAGDGNFLNDQGFGGLIGYQGDNSGGAGIGAGDILHVWFSHDQDSISTHIHTTFPPPNQTPGLGLIYRVHLADDCIWLEGWVPSRTYVGEPHARVNFVCDTTRELVDGEITVDELGDGTGVTTLTYPRSADALFADGSSITEPSATSRAMWGADGAPRRPTAPQIDNTLPGDEYVVAAGEEVEEAAPPKVETPKAPKRQNCKKLKNKKKRRACIRRQRQGNACGAFQPGERGAEVEGETLILTDDHTEESPLEHTVNLDASIANIWVPGYVGGPSPGPAAVPVDGFNIQVRTKNGDAGLWALVEFPDRRDYDLDLFHVDGSYAARARGFNTAANTDLSTAGHGGEHGTNYEKLLGIRTANCGGWTLEASNHFGEGGEFTVKLWLGPAETDPLEPGAETP